MRISRCKGKKLLLVGLILLLLGTGLYCLNLWEQKELDLGEADEPEELERVRVYYEDSWYALRDDQDRILLIGLDKYTSNLSDPESYINNQQADFLLLMVIDDAEKSFFAIHINRDTMAEIERIGLAGSRLGTVEGQLALAHTYGSGRNDSCRNTVHAVSRFLYDTPIPHYFSMTMDAIPVLNDLAGGVTVTVEDDFSAVDPSIVQGKQQRLTGEQALSFVRSRGGVGDSSNLNRMARQREYMNGLYLQLITALQADEGFAARLGLKLSEYSTSDLTTDQLSALAERVKDYHFSGIKTIEGETVLGKEFMEFYADEVALQKLVIECFYEIAD